MPDLVLPALTVLVFALLVLLAGALDRYLAADLPPVEPAVATDDRSGDEVVR